MHNSEINTQRLILRPIKKGDAESVFRYRSDANTNKYQGWIPKTINDVVSFIENRVSPTININGTWFQFVVIKKDDGALIGDVGIHFFDPDNKQVEIGCTIDKNYQKHGYASEALSEIFQYIFKTLDKHRIIASIDPRNEGSIRLVEKLGFRKEAHFKESIFQDGEWLDDLVYAILRSEWKE